MSTLQNMKRMPTLASSACGTTSSSCCLRGDLHANRPRTSSSFVCRTCSRHPSSDGSRSICRLHSCLIVGPRAVGEEAEFSQDVGGQMGRLEKSTVLVRLEAVPTSLTCPNSQKRGVLQCRSFPFVLLFCSRGKLESVGAHAGYAIYGVRVLQVPKTYQCVSGEVFRPIHMSHEARS